VLFALRPDRTWRARVTFVDDDRLAAALFRNGRHAASAVFSRPDLWLPTDNVKDPAKAQMLTGAAAFILTQLSQVHEELQDGLYGAQQWKSVALQVIASSKSLLADDGNRVATRARLLAKAVDTDPANELARFEYLWVTHEHTPYAEMDFHAFARAIDRQYAGSRIEKVSTDREGWMPLKIRILYSSATQWLNAWISGGGTDADRTAMLTSARNRAKELDRLCDTGQVSWKSKELQRLQAAMQPHARVLLACLDAVKEDTTKAGDQAGNATAQHSHEDPPASPRLAYDHACLHMFTARRKGLKDDASQQEREYAIEDLRHALVTEKDKKDAQGDPCFTDLRSDPRFQELVGTQPTATCNRVGEFVLRHLRGLGCFVLDPAAGPHPVYGSPHNGEKT
jgi:hypothetical protein